MGTTSLTYAAVYLCVIFILMQCDHKKQSTMILNMLEECLSATSMIVAEFFATRVWPEDRQHVVVICSRQ
jgi:hypothetical protein